jgi:hypothetical protein
MLLSKHSKKHIGAIINHCVENGMSVESTMGLSNHLVRIMNRLDKFEGRTAEALESAPTDNQQTKGKNYPRVVFKDLPGQCLKCGQLPSVCKQFGCG